MASEHGSGSSKHSTSDEESSLHYSHSSSSSFSTNSNPLESDIDDKDHHLPTKSENENSKSSPAEWSMMSVPAEWSMMSLSPRAGYSPSEMPQNSMSTISPPPVQTMGRFPGYDPNRIPSSVFATNKPAEWSMASNESLFSIHMGNNSFTIDQINLLKSGELRSPDEFMNSVSGLPPITETSTNELHGHPENEAASDNGTERESIECEEVHENNNKEISTTAERIQLSASASNISESPGMPHTPARASHQSDASRMSNGSFAFPVLGGETPQKSQVQKPDVQVQQQETPEEPQKAAETKWFCFSCWPFGN